MLTAARQCADCGAEFTWTSRHPTRRFCGSRCKARWWRTHRDYADAADVRGAGDTGDAADQDRLRPPAPPLGTGHECPNCGQHITVLNLIVSADSGVD